MARLRAVARQDFAARPILLKTEMVAGHGGKSGRYDAWEQYAFEAAFLLTALGAATRPDVPAAGGPDDGVAQG